MVGKVSLDVSAADTLYNTHASEWPSHHSFKPDHLVTVKSSKPAVFIGCNGLVFKTMSGGQKIHKTQGAHPEMKAVWQGSTGRALIRIFTWKAAGLNAVSGAAA